jgi:hypothetical protein
VEIFDTALAASDVEAIVNAGPSGKCRALDHYFCYRTQALENGPPFAPPLGVRVADQFGVTLVDVEAPLSLCTPANKNDEDADAVAATDHLRAYAVRRPPRCWCRPPRT